MCRVSVDLEKHCHEIYHLLFVCLMHTDSTGLLSSSFGQGTGPIFLDNVACVGTENSLEDCTHDPSTTDCTHHEDAAVLCNPHCKCQLTVRR